MNNKINIANINDDKFTIQILNEFGYELSCKYMNIQELKDLHRNIGNLIDDASKCKCLPEWLEHHTELNTFPYGNDFEYDICKKCKTKHNLKFIR